MAAIYVLTKDNALKINGFLSLSRCFTILFLMAAMLVFPVFGSVSVEAQEGNLTNSLILQKDLDHYKLAPYIYVTKDSGQPLNFNNYRKLINRHLSGDRGDIVVGDVLNLGASAVPHWIVFSVNNQSRTGKWVLSFGQAMDGRIGLVEDIFVYDHASQKTYVNTLLQSKTANAENKKMSGASLVLDIPRGKKTLVFVYIVPKRGMPSTLAPELLTESAYMHKRTGFFTPPQMLGFFFILVAGVFLATILLHRMWSSVLFIAYYVVLLMLFRYQNDFIQIDSMFSTHITGVLFNVTVLLGLFMNKFFLKIGNTQRLQGSLILLLSFGLVLSTFGAAVLMADDSSFQIMLMFGPPLFVLFFLFILSLARGYMAQSEGYQFAIGWFVVFAGACTTFISLVNIFPPSALLLNSYWYGLIIQGVLFLAAVMTRVSSDERVGELAGREMQEDLESIENIMASRESSDNARLLRMIEHERQVLTELRERESEQSEAMKNAKEEADHANNAKSAFLAVVSHEIRTPMAGIMAMIRFLLETHLNKEQKDYAQTLQDSGEAMLTLLNDILDFEKIESDNMELEHIDFDLYRLIQGVKTLMSGHAEAKNIHLNVNLDPEVSQYVIGDSVRLRQVLLNLAGNSIKFTEEGGVTIHVKPAPFAAGAISGTGSEHPIRFAIEDTGVGLSKEAQQNIFNPFAQADSSVARKFGGTGLGLAISQKLIEAMGGHIEIDSTEGQGSTFFFTLVMDEGSADAIESADAASQQDMQETEKSLRILIVEDNEINQKLMKELVDRMGHETSVASSGEEALEMAGGNDLDMILMDVQLPGMTGMGTTKAIRAMKNQKRSIVPVVAMTGNVQQEDVQKCYAANMNGHLAKPVDPKKLKDQISKVIEGNLDNPVEIAEEKRDDHVQITQLNIGTEKFGTDIPDTSDVDEVVAVSDSAEEVPKKDVAPIMAALGGGQDKSMNISDDELDEDSFAEAIYIAEIKNGNGTAQVFDIAMLNVLRGSVGDEQFNILLQDMLIKAEEIVGAIGLASGNSDIVAVSARAHELKGMAGNFGFTEISALAADIEVAARENRLDGIQETLPALPVAHDKAVAALQEWMETTAAD